MSIIEINELDKRTRKILDQQLMVNERAIFGAIASDKLFSRWCTRVILTDVRILTIRSFLFDMHVRGMRIARISSIERSQTSPVITISSETREFTLEFSSISECEEIVTRITKNMPLA